MKKYEVTIPGLTEIIEAENEQEAMEIFMNDYDIARLLRESEFYEPIVEEIKEN